MARVPAARKPVNPYQAAADGTDLNPSNLIAFDIISTRRDLLPSVERIMNAGLDDAATLNALTLFRDALDALGDPNRDPRVAIAEALRANG